MIQSFAASETQLLWETGKSRGFPADIARTALRKLLIVHGAGDLSDLRVPPGNRLEKLKSDRKGQHSIRINNQYRICFAWKHDGAYEVEITDHH